MSTCRRCRILGLSLLIWVLAWFVAQYGAMRANDALRFHLEQERGLRLFERGPAIECRPDWTAPLEA